MTQQTTGRIGYEGVGHDPYGTGPVTPGWDVVPAPRPAPVAPHPASAWAATPYATVAPAPPASSGAPRSVVVVAVTVVALAVLTLVGVLLYPRIAAPVVTTATTAAPTTVVVPSPMSPGSSSGSSAGAYSCGSANGYAIEVLNGNVPCTSARWVTTMWTTDGTTPMSGTGPAGTPYSWTCSGVTTSGDEVASCVSKKGSTFTISR